MKTILRSMLVVMVLSLVLTAFTGCDLIDKIKEILNGDVCEHEIVTDAAIEATCTASGLTEGYHCAKCGDIILEQFETKPIPHTKEVIPGVKPTCTEGGISDGAKCSVCDEVIAEQTALDPLGHTGGQATCQASAVCETCEQPYGEIGSHVEEIVAGKAATCTEAGLTEGKKCSVCGETTLAQDVITALGHTKEVLPAKDATCTETGLTAGEKCTVCNEVLVAQTELSKLPHTYLDDNDTTCEKCDYVRDCKHLEKVTVPGKEATCTEAGLTDGEKCKHCGDILKAQEEIVAKGHTKQAVPGKEATCTEAGLTAGEKCSVCNATLTAQTEIPAKGHTEVADAGKDATCLEAGLTAGKHCSVCEAVLVKQEAIPAKGHTEQVVPGKAATCLETGLTDGKKCFVCGDVLVAQEEIALADHTWVDATAEAPKHCSVCDRAVIELYYKNINNWTEVNLYAWDGTGPLTPAWPGTPMTAVEGADGWYKIEYEIAKYDALSIIFNAYNGSPQTGDLTYDPAKIYWVGETAYATWAEANAVTISGKLDAEHYLDMLPSLSVTVVDGDTTYTGAIVGDTWSIRVPEDLFDFTVVIHDEQGRFHDIEMMYAMVDTNVRPAEKLVPVMAKYDLWGTHSGAYVPDQNKLVYGEDGSYSLVKTESGAALSETDWWASGVTTGAYFEGASSEHWIVETDITLLASAAWNQWWAGITVDDNEFIMIMDRDWQLIAWTEWNLASGSSGFDKDIITNDGAAAAGIVGGSNWAPEGRPMKVTAVRDNKELYIFLNNVLVSKLDISDSLLPNSNRGPSNKIGFMVKSGTQAKFSNYWYELGAENVAAYLESKKAADPTVNVVDADGNAVEGGSVQFYKEVLISTDKSNNYAETVEWQLATEADFVEGMRLKAVLSGVDATGARVNGEPVSFANNACVFTLGKNDKIEFFSGFYTVVGADKGRVDFNNSDSIPSGDVFIVTKVQISAEQLNALLSANNGESVIGIEMRADGRAVENMLWINGGDIKLLSGDWSEVGKLMSNGVLNEYGQALAGDGLYFGMQYVASSGMTYTWLGTTPYNLVRIRDWGTGGSDNPGYRSFDANSKITGYSFGYVHCWTGNDANLRADVKFSDVYVGSEKPVEPATLLEAEKAAFANQSTSNTINGVSYKNAKGTLSYDAELDAAKYVIDNTAGAGKSIVPFLKGFSITDASAYTTVTFKVKIDASTCSEGFALTVRNYNKSSVTPQVITAGEWVEITLNLADFTQYFDATVSGYMVTMDTSNMKNIGLVFFVQDSETMTIETGFTMYFTDFIVK